MEKDKISWGAYALMNIFRVVDRQLHLERKKTSAF
jgi:hypothetical protein